MRREKLHEIRITNHSELLINPDASVTVTKSINYFHGAHTMAMTRALSSMCAYGAAFNQVEESSLWRCAKEVLRPDQRAVIGPDRGRLRNSFLMIKSVNPLSVTSQAYGLGDRLWNRLKPHDIAAVYHGLTESFYRLHELQREPDTPDPALIKLAPGRPPFKYAEKTSHPYVPARGAAP